MVAVLFYYLCFVKKAFRHILPILGLSLFSVALQAQTDLTFKFETAGAAGGGEHAPFWHTSNRQGLSSTNPNNAYARFAALGGVHRPSGFGVDYGVDLGGGGTIAYICALYGMEVIDSGVAVLNMHAPMEIISKADLYEAAKAYRAFMLNA